MAADPEHERHVMSQTSSAPRRIPVLMRWLPPAAIPLSPIHGNPCGRPPVIRFNPALEASSTLSPAAARSHPARLAQCRASIECAANLKSP